MGQTVSRVLIVDDDPFVRSITAAVFTDIAGTVVKACASGDEALLVASDFGPTLVLMDLVMPGMDGRAAWQALRMLLRPPPPVVFLTARDDPQSRDDIGALGVAGIIAKPFDPATLVNDVRRLVGLDRATPVSAAERLATLGVEFRASLVHTSAHIAEAWSGIREAGWQRDVAESLLERVHKLAGSAGLFHLDAVGAAANELERLLLAHTRLARQPTLDEMQKLEAAITTMIASCRDSGDP